MTISAPPRPYDEAYRQQVLDSLAILDIEPSPNFDRLTALAKAQFRTKYAVISLIDRDRQWFLSVCGLDAKQTSRDDAFCAHALVSDEIMLVLDATRDPRFVANPLVAGPPHIRFYAGAPIHVHGAAMGTICIIDDEPRAAFSDEDKECLSALARVVEDEIELRRYAAESVADLGAQLRSAQVLADAGKNAKAQFLSLMSHELRTPLNAVIGFAECLSQEILGPLGRPEYKDFAEQVLAGGKRQLELIDRVLRLADRNDVGVQEAALDLNRLVGKCVTAMQGAARLAGVGLDWRPPEPGVWLNGDPLHIEQIVLELIGNGVKFTPQGGRVRVGLCVDGDDCVALEVVDTGIGIAPDAVADALAAFQQLSAGNSRPFEGAGLGLPIVERLAGLHGASLTLSAPSDVGTRAAVRFPAYRTLAQPLIHTAAG